MSSSATGDGARSRRVASGTLLALVLASLATALATALPLVGAPVIGLLAGVVVAVVRPPSARLVPGIRLCSHEVLQVAVALLGLQLTVGEALRVGGRALPVMVGTLVVCLIAAAVAGTLLGIPRDLRTLVGVGTAICGASAIAAVTAIIDAAGVDVAYALTTVFLFNAVAVVVFPLVGHLLHMSQAGFGLFAGTAVNDTSSVVAAATVYGAVARSNAVVVKLTRTLFIIPVALFLAIGRGGARTGRVPLHRLVPWFLVAFVALAALASVVRVPGAVLTADGRLVTFLISTALAAIGLSTDLAGLRRAGPRPLVYGALLWLVISVASLALQAATRAT